MRSTRLKNMSWGRLMVDDVSRERPPLKNCSLWLRMAAATFGDIRARATMSLVRGKEINMEVEPKGMRIDLASMRVKLSEGFLHSVVHVCVACEVLRISRKLRDVEMRSSITSTSDYVYGNLKLQLSILNTSNNCL